MEECHEKLHGIAQGLGIGAYVRHVLVCIGPDCCTPDVGQQAWETLKSELKHRGLTATTAPNACYRTKASCLRICAGGPILVVYPEGTWYSGMTVERIPRFVDEHLLRGRPVGDWIFACNPLPSEPIADSDTTCPT